MASGGVRVAVIEVGGESSSSGGKYQFQPPTTNALVGTIITFDFSRYPGNHSVTQSTFDSPCQPLAGGFDSGVIFPSTAGRKEWNMTITDTAPIWFYCKELSPTPHCNLGMVGVINAPAYNEPFTAFLAAAKTAPVATPVSTTTTSESSSTAPAPAPTPSSSTSSTTPKQQTAAIAGGVVGGVAGLVILIITAFYWYRRRATRRAEVERLTRVTAFPAEVDTKDEVERLRMQVQRLEAERRRQGMGGGDPPPEGPAMEMLVHTDSGLRLGSGRIIEELPPRYVPE